MKSFQTHTGEIIKGKRLQAARDSVCNDLIKLAHDIREEGLYGDHVTKEEKDKIMQDSIIAARRVKLGYVDNMTVAQRLNTVLTGECIDLLP